MTGGKEEAREMQTEPGLEESSEEGFLRNGAGRGQEEEVSPAGIPGEKGCQCIRLVLK